MQGCLQLLSSSTFTYLRQQRPGGSGSEGTLSWLWLKCCEAAQAAFRALPIPAYVRSITDGRSWTQDGDSFRSRFSLANLSVDSRSISSAAQRQNQTLCEELKVEVYELSDESHWLRKMDLKLEHFYKESETSFEEKHLVLIRIQCLDTHRKKATGASALSHDHFSRLAKAVLEKKGLNDLCDGNTHRISILWSFLTTLGKNQNEKTLLSVFESHPAFFLFFVQAIGAGVKPEELQKATVIEDLVDMQGNLEDKKFYQALEKGDIEAIKNTLERELQN